MRILNQAKIAAPTFVAAMDTPVTHTLRYAPAPIDKKRLAPRSDNRALGADVYIGDARLPRVLNDVGVTRAKALYSVTNDDYANLESGRAVLRRDAITWRGLMRVFGAGIMPCHRIPTWASPRPDGEARQTRTYEVPPHRLHC